MINKIDFVEFEQDTATEIDTDNFYIGSDSPEDIKQCLNCTKSECNNCLRFKNNI